RPAVRSSGDAPMPYSDESLVNRLRLERSTRRELIARLGVTGIGAATAGLLIAGASGSTAARWPASPGPHQAGDSPVRGGILRLGGLPPVARIAPPTFASGTARAVLGLATEYLVRTAPDGTIEPQLAVHWEVTADRHTWTFTLRP